MCRTAELEVGLGLNAVQNRLANPPAIIVSSIVGTGRQAPSRQLRGWKSLYHQSSRISGPRPNRQPHLAEEAQTRCSKRGSAARTVPKRGPDIQSAAYPQLICFPVHLAISIWQRLAVAHGPAHGNEVPARGEGSLEAVDPGDDIQQVGMRASRYVCCRNREGRVNTRSHELGALEELGQRSERVLSTQGSRAVLDLEQIHNRTRIGLLLQNRDPHIGTSSLASPLGNVARRNQSRYTSP